MKEPTKEDMKLAIEYKNKEIAALKEAVRTLQQVVAGFRRDFLTK